MLESDRGRVRAFDMGFIINGASKVRVNDVEHILL